MKNKLVIFCVTILLSLIGILMIYSSSSVWAMYKFNNPFRYVIHQSIFFILGLIILLFFSKYNYKKLCKYSNILLFGSILLLLIVLIPGIGVVRNGSRSWFSIMGFSIQPSEFAKVSLIIFVSKYLSNHDKNMKHIIKYVFPILSIVFFVFGLIMLEPDFGSGVIIVLSIVVLLFTSDIPFSFFFNIGLLGIIGAIILILIAPYRLARITSFLNPWNDPLGSGFQMIMSLYAIGPGGLFGLGLGNSIQKHFYLPEPQTDFIFSIISEELGFIGILIISILYILLFYKIIDISLKTKDLFGKYLALGLGLELILQTVLNLCVVVGLIPVTGVTLPFLSYGGSSLVISMLMVGIILNISNDT